MEELKTPNNIIKSIQIENEGINYKCNITINDKYIDAVLLYNNSQKLNGKISVWKIQSQITAFEDYDINDIFEEIKQLNNEEFSLTKEKDKFTLKIKFIILKREKYIIIDLFYDNIIKQKKAL